VCHPNPKPAGQFLVSQQIHDSRKKASREGLMQTTWCAQKLKNVWKMRLIFFAFLALVKFSNMSWNQNVFLSAASSSWLLNDNVVKEVLQVLLCSC